MVGPISSGFSVRSFINQAKGARFHTVEPHPKGHIEVVYHPEPKTVTPVVNGADQSGSAEVLRQPARTDISQDEQETFMNTGDLIKLGEEVMINSALNREALRNARGNGKHNF